MHPLLHSAWLSSDSSSHVLPIGIMARKPPPFSHPPWLPCSLKELQAGRMWGCGGGLFSSPPFCCGQARLGGRGCLPFPASIRWVNSCHVVYFSHVLLCFWLGLLSVLHFLWFVRIWAIEGIYKNHKQPGGQKPQQGVCFEPKPMSVNRIILSTICA